MATEKTKVGRPAGKKVGRPPGSPNATPSQLRERAKALLKEAQLKERIKKLKSKD